MIKDELLKMLIMADGKYLSGQYMCGKLDVSRQAVWKAINALKKEGYIIESDRKSGYKLLYRGDKLSKAGIEAGLVKGYIDYDVIYEEQVDSTNLLAMRLAGEAINQPDKSIHGKVIIANEQTGGMGRRGRGFISEKDTGIYTSIILKPDMLPQEVSSITLVIAVAVTKAVKKLIDTEKHEVGIKWPNDVLIDRKKVCGILTQMNAVENYISHIVCGFGLNVNNKSFNKEIESCAISLYQATGKFIDRNAFIADILNEFSVLYEKFIEGKGIGLIKDEYTALLLDIGEEISIYNGMIEDTRPEDIRHGILKGIDMSGELLVEVDGELTRVLSGEVSIRKKID
ncbi:MAG: biotin--[acetyl-CoA-carboxylase] ligase [Lachnospiraceae bacterium]|nr:biotin--[acetyl-CoA-carboxylase] ligase [Lachnospiraceae bacterium]